MTLQERYDHLLSLTTELVEIETYEAKCRSFGGKLPLQDKERKRKVLKQLESIITRVKQLTLG